MGWLSHAQYDYPRNAKRMVRSDGKLMHEIKANDEVSIGMIASYPTPEQYERAANVALAKAARIRIVKAACIREAEARQSAVG